MNIDKFMFTCPLCRSKFQHGPHKYVGHFMKKYDIMVCNSCWVGNWNGWASIYEEILINHLKEKVLPIPERNEKGWLARD